MKGEEKMFKMFERILMFERELEILKSNDLWEKIIIPFLIVVLISFLIGLERQNMGKSAGISPHILIGMSSVTIAIIQRYMFLEQGGAAVGAENQRLIAQVLPGVGFIGAGVILQGERTIIGLTTAATIWTCAIVGLVVGSGFVLIGGGFGIAVLLFIYLRDLKRGINPFRAHFHYDFGDADIDEDLKRHG